jgi:hypothetical protein
LLVPPVVIDNVAAMSYTRQFAQLPINCMGSNLLSGSPCSARSRASTAFQISVSHRTSSKNSFFKSAMLTRSGV